SFRAADRLVSAADLAVGDRWTRLDARGFNPLGDDTEGSRVGSWSTILQLRDAEKGRALVAWSSADTSDSAPAIQGLLDIQRGLRVGRFRRAGPRDGSDVLRPSTSEVNIPGATSFALGLVSRPSSTSLSIGKNRCVSARSDTFQGGDALQSRDTLK